MKNKIVLGSVTLLSALVLAACGNGEKKAPETTAAPRTEATTTAPTTTTLASSETKEVSLAETQRVGREDVGYFNVPKDWVAYKDPNGGPQFQYAAKDSYNMITINGYDKDQLHVNAGETFGAELLANRLYEGWQYNPKVEKNKRKRQSLLARMLSLLRFNRKMANTCSNGFSKEAKKYMTFYWKEQRLPPEQ